MVALADPDPKGRSQMAAKIGAPNAYADYREMLERHKPDLVSLGMRHADQHHAVSLAVLRSGAHLYCEKPFTTTPMEGDELLREAESKKLKIAVAHTMRMSPRVIALKAALAEGLIGDLVECRAYGKQDARAGGEDMMVLGTHLFDLMRLLLGDPISCSAEVLVGARRIVKADARQVKDVVGWVAGDRIAAQFLFPNSVGAAFTSAGKLRETVGHWGMELHGSGGVARLNCDLEPGLFSRQKGVWSSQGRGDAWAPLELAAKSSSLHHNANPVTDWLAAIRLDREPECSGRNGLWAVEMAMGVYHSALTGARVDFPLRNRQHALV